MCLLYTHNLFSVSRSPLEPYIYDRYQRAIVFIESSSLYSLFREQTMSMYVWVEVATGSHGGVNGEEGGEKGGGVWVGL